MSCADDLSEHYRLVSWPPTGKASSHNTERGRGSVTFHLFSIIKGMIILTSFNQLEIRANVYKANFLEKIL